MYVFLLLSNKTLLMFEFLVSRQELVGWLQQQIAEQKRADLATSAAPVISEVGSGASLPSKDASISPGVQLILPIDAKKQRKQVKQLFLDRGVYCNSTPVSGPLI